MRTTSRMTRLSAVGLSLAWILAACGVDDSTATDGEAIKAPDAADAGRTVAAWGDNSVGQADVPAGLDEVVAIAAGSVHSMALVGP